MERFNTNLNYKVLTCHPKRPDQEQLDAVERECRDADLIDFAYYKTADMLLSNFPWLKDKKSIGEIHNPYCITESDWNHYDMVVANNKTIYEALGKITTSPLEYIGNTVDTEFWQYNNDWQPNHNVIMVAARIEGKKGILPVAKACAKLNLRFILVGSVSDVNYFHEIIRAAPVDFRENTTDEELRSLYYDSTIHVCNSVDDFESGPNPMLEAMLCGVPVLTRRVGHVPELYNGENMVIHEGQPDDVDAIADKLLEMISDKKRLQSLRDAGWNSAKVRSNERRAYRYQKLYRQVAHSEQTPVSIIMPICGKPDIVRHSLDAAARQTYQNKELIVADDGLDTDNEQVVREFAQFVDFPVRYMRTAHIVLGAGDQGYKEYGLARARNMAVLESTGEILIFDDERQIMEDTCVEEFVKHMKPKHWLFGNKGANKKSFVENLSAVFKEDFVNAGMFNQLGNLYGFQSQELRYRIRNQGMHTEYVESAKAIPMGRSSNRNRKRSEIINSKTMLWKLNLDQ